MPNAFVDHFKDVAQNYLEHRPTYPPELFEWLAGQCKQNGLAWDCAIGSGQAAASLAPHLLSEVATDASAAQIFAGKPHDQIVYRVATAENSGLESASVDLVIVAQALHWFDVERFYAEVRRVLKPEDHKKKNPGFWPGLLVQIMTIIAHKHDSLCAHRQGFRSPGWTPPGRWLR